MTHAFSVLYVDLTNLGTANGSSDLPFPTINAALSRIIEKADNATVPYEIKISPGVYAEELNLSHPSLVQLTLEGCGASTQITNPGMVLGANVVSLLVKNIQFNGRVHVPSVNTTANINFLNVTFNGNFDVIPHVGSGLVSNLMNCRMNGALFFNNNGNSQNNSNGLFVTDCEGIYGALTAVNRANIVLDNTTIAGPSVYVDSTSTLFTCNGVRNEATPMTIDGRYEAEFTFIHAIVHVGSHAVFETYGSFIDPSLVIVAPGGSYRNHTTQRMIAYNANAHADWNPVPLHGADALDQLAARSSGHAHQIGHLLAEMNTQAAQIAALLSQVSTLSSAMTQQAIQIAQLQEELDESECFPCCECEEKDE
jgi:hypothetical protein